MNFEPIIGLEIHVEMKTKSKMFSASPNGFSHHPNTAVTPYDLACPGTMPRVNKQAVINAIRVASALHMEIDPYVRFDRKNYFYSDLPKGYQITQQFHPLGKNGYVEIVGSDGKKRRIGVVRLHMEEDSCKQLHFPDCTLLDYNRAGVPLIEIVSAPEVKNGTEAMRFVSAIRNIVLYSGVSDGKMEEGSLRCDVNVSLRPFGSSKLGTKVEIKNISTLKNIETGIDYEISRQSKSLLQGIPVLQETRRFDEASRETVSMRVKSDDIDYKYMPESNLAPITLSEAFVKEAIASCPELYEAKKERYLGLGLTEADAEVILDDPSLASYFEKAVEGYPSAKAIANWLNVEIRGYLNKKSISINEISLAPSALREIALLQDDGYTHQQCADVLNYTLANGGTPLDAKLALKIEKQISDEAIILPYVNAVLDENPQSIADYKSGKGRAIGYLVGQVMKKGKGKLHPATVALLVNQEIAKR